MANNGVPLMHFDASQGIRQSNLSNLNPVIAKGRSFKKFRSPQDSFKGFRSRNPKNLHVIYSYDTTSAQQPVLKQIPMSESTEEAPFVEAKFTGNPRTKLLRKYASANMRKRRERRRNRRYRGQANRSSKWLSTDYKTPDWKESVEEVEDVPMDEGDFEEVEVASTEDNKDESKNPEIPVGFRRYMLKYLGYKKKSFFRPKFYHLCHQRTIVNCLNLQEDESVEVDVVSEAEYEADNSCAEKNGIDSEQAGEMTIFDVVDDDLTEIETCDEASPEPVEEEKVQKFEGSGVSCLPHVYNKTTFCQNLSSDCYQGASIIQEILDAWNSHLIGLEYVLEIREKKGVSEAEYYHCVLCCDDWSAKHSSGVVDHVMGKEHIVKYLDRHFASRGYKFSDHNYSEILLQRYCEEINRALGYNYMCITYKDYFMNHKKKVEDSIEKLPHAYDAELRLNFSSYVDVSCDIIDCINEMLTNVMSEKCNMQKSAEICELNSSVYSENKLAEEIDVSLSKECAPEERINVTEVSNIDASEVPKAAEKTEGKEISNANKEPRAIRPHLTTSKLRSYLMLKNALNRKQKSTKKNDELDKSQDTQKAGVQPISKELEVINDITKVVPTNLTVEKSTAKLQGPQSLNKSQSQATKGKVVTQVPQNKSACQAGQNKSVNQGAQKTAVTQATQKKSVNQAAQKKSVSPASQNKSLNQVAQNKPVSKAVQNQLECPNTKIKSSQAAQINSVTPSAQNKSAAPSVQNKSLSQAAQNQSVQHSAPSAVPGKVLALGIKKKKFPQVGVKSAVPQISQKKIVSQITAKRTIPQKKSVARIAQVKAVRQVIQVPSATHPNPVGKDDDDDIEVVVLKEIAAGPSQPKERVASSEVPILEDKSVKVKPQQKTLHSKHCLKRVLAKTAQSKGENTSSLKDLDKSSIKITVENEKAKHAPKKFVKNEGGVVKVKVDNLKSASKGSRNKQSPKRIVSKHSSRQSSVSPLRRRSKSSRSPSFLSKNSSLERRLSRSPVRYKSPLRLPFFKQYSRSPVRHSLRSLRSPHRKGSRSPLRRLSRSPQRRLSRSPRRRVSRSPRRRASRSPRRRRSRTPRRHSRSPLRRHSKSPKRRSRSPHRRNSRSPRRKFSRSPLRISSRSPPKHVFKGSRSPPSMRSRSPYWNHSRSPIHPRLSESPDRNFNTTYDSRSPTKRHLENIRDLGPMKGMYSGNSRSKKYNDSITAGISSSKAHHNYSSLNIKGQFSKHHAGSDLDPVSDEDESVYFNVSEKRPQPQANSQGVLLQVLQKLSMPNLNLGDPLVQKYIKFAESHRSELNELLNHDVVPSFRDSQFRNLLPESNASLLQHFGANLTPSHAMHPSAVMPGSNIPFLNNPMQPSSQPPVEGPHFSVLGNMNKVPYEVPHPGGASFPGFGHPANQFDPLFRGRAQVPAEVMFRDLKAKVNKLFGPKKNEPEPERPIKTESDQVPTVWAGSQNFAAKNSFQQKEGPCFADAPPKLAHESQFFPNPLHVPPPDAKVMFCEAPHAPNRSLFPVVAQDFNSGQQRGKAVADRKYSLAQRLASILIKVGMIDVPAPLLQEMLMKIGAFSSCPPQDIPEGEIVSILKKLGYLH